MQHKPGGANDPKRWLKNAEADLAYAMLPLPPGGMYEQPCFHAQQAAEKSVKAVLLHLGIDFPFTHNLKYLLNLLPTDLEVPNEVRGATDLTPYATITRYPGELEPATESDRDSAVTVAKATFEWAKGIICPS
jgi:HEPN domain-containing protein